MQLLRSNIDLSLTMFQDIAFAADGLPGRKSLGLGDQRRAFDIDPKTMQFKSPQVSSRGQRRYGGRIAGHGRGWRQQGRAHAMPK